MYVYIHEYVYTMGRPYRSLFECAFVSCHRLLPNIQIRLH
jgi:hypothetical protein